MSDPRHIHWVLLWGRDDRIGGAERRMAHVVPEFCARGDTVTSVIVKESAGLVRNLMADAGSQIATLRQIGDPFDRPPKNATVVVIGHGVRASVLARSLRLIPRHSRLQVWHAQTGLDVTHSRLHVGLGRLGRPLVAQVLANSYAAAEYARSKLGYRAEIIEVVPSALGDPWFSAQPTHRKRAVPMVAMIGNDRIEKGHVEGVAAFARLTTGARLRVYTDRPDSVMTAAKGLGVADRVDIVLGEPVTPGTYADIDVLLHPSRAESMPLTVLEAISQFVPVVACDVGDIARWIERTAPANNPDRLSRLLGQAVSGDLTGLLGDQTRIPTVSAYVDRLRALAQAGE